ncbi:MAG: S-layer homology domain-containing protein [Butyricicoccus sp.]
MLKKNMRKRLLAGALATIMALTMCPTWALAVDEDINTLPAPEGQMPAVDSTPAEDTIQTPDAGTQGQTEPKDTEQAGQLENQDPAQAPSGGTDIENTGNNSSSNENDSQNNDAESNSPANTISVQELQSDRAWYQREEAMYFILLPKRGTPKNNRDQGQENYLPSSDNETAGTKGSDGGVDGLSAYTGYRGYVTAKAMRILAYRNAIDGFDYENGLNDTDYLEVPENLGFFTAKNWTNGSYTPTTNTDETARNALLNTDSFTFTPDGVEIVWYTIKKQSDGIHVDGYLRGVPITVTYHTNYEGNNITGMTEDSKEVSATSGHKYTVQDIDFTDFERPENYTFAGWYVGSTKYDVGSRYLLTGDLHLYAKWVKNAYNVTYYVDGAKYEQEKTYKVNSAVDVKTDRPEKEGYTFKGWKTKDVTVTNDTFTMPEKDVRFDAEFEINKYTVTWENEDNSFITSAKVEYKNTPKSNPAVSKASDAQFDYEFVGWKVKGDESNKIVAPTEIAVTEDVTYVAVFKPVTRQYTVTWKNSDDAVDSLATEKVDYNGKPTLDPRDKANKASNAQYTYEFKGWKLADTADTALVDPTTIAVVKDVTYIAVFKPITRQYTVTWKISDDAVDSLATEKVDYNGKPTENPTASKESDKDYNYIFKGWKVSGTADKDTVEPTDIVVTADVTYIAVFDKTARQKNYNYTINKHFYNEKDVEVNVDKGGAKSAVENTDIKDLYTANKQETFGNQNYVYVPGLTKVTDNLKKLTKDVTIDLYYYLDVKGGEKPDETGNGTPDAWEYRLAFKVVNGEWNKGGSADIVVYVPFKDYKTGETLKYVVVPYTSIPAVGEKPNSGYRAGSWDTTPVANATVEKDTVFTYTYARRSSSGGGGGGSRKPTVTIPDDVPTGLNGDDHYAYIVGYPNGNVEPNGNITRAEVATIFFRLLTEEVRTANSTQSNSLSDVTRGQWFNHAVSTLSSMGIVKGHNDGTFAPNAPITRAEFAAIAARLDDKNTDTSSKFTDIASHWAKNEIGIAANKGWINGYPDGTFRPNQYITRAEAMTLVNRVLNRLPENSSDLLDSMIKWPDNSDASAWYYLAVQEATNSHYYDLKENKCEKWSKLRETRDWTELEK